MGWSPAMTRCRRSGVSVVSRIGRLRDRIRRPEQLPHGPLEAPLGVGGPREA